MGDDSGDSAAVACSATPAEVAEAVAAVAAAMRNEDGTLRCRSRLEVAQIVLSFPRPVQIGASRVLGGFFGSHSGGLHALRPCLSSNRWFFGWSPLTTKPQRIAVLARVLRQFRLGLSNGFLMTAADAETTLRALLQFELSVEVNGETGAAVDAAVPDALVAELLTFARLMFLSQPGGVGTSLFRDEQEMQCDHCGAVLTGRGKHDDPKPSEPLLLGNAPVAVNAQVATAKEEGSGNKIQASRRDDGKMRLTTTCELCNVTVRGNNESNLRNSWIQHITSLPHRSKSQENGTVPGWTPAHPRPPPHAARMQGSQGSSHSARCVLCQVVVSGTAISNLENNWKQHILGVVHRQHARMNAAKPAQLRLRDVDVLKRPNPVEALPAVKPTAPLAPTVEAVVNVPAGATIRPKENIGSETGRNAPRKTAPLAFVDSAHRCSVAADAFRDINGRRQCLFCGATVLPADWDAHVTSVEHRTPLLTRVSVMYCALCDTRVLGRMSPASLWNNWTQHVQSNEHIANARANNGLPPAGFVCDVDAPAWSSLDAFPSKSRAEGRATAPRIRMCCGEAVVSTSGAGERDEERYIAHVLDCHCPVESAPSMCHACGVAVDPSEIPAHLTLLSHVAAVLALPFASSEISERVEVLAGFEGAGESHARRRVLRDSLTVLFAELAETMDDPSRWRWKDTTDLDARRLALDPQLGFADEAVDPAGALLTFLRPSVVVWTPDAQVGSTSRLRRGLEKVDAFSQNLPDGTVSREDLIHALTRHHFESVEQEEILRRAFHPQDGFLAACTENPETCRRGVRDPDWSRLLAATSAASADDALLRGFEQVEQSTRLPLGACVSRSQLHLEVQKLGLANPDQERLLGFVLHPQMGFLSPCPEDPGAYSRAREPDVARLALALNARRNALLTPAARLVDFALSCGEEDAPLLSQTLYDTLLTSTSGVAEPRASQLAVVDGQLSANPALRDLVSRCVQAGPEVSPNLCGVPYNVPNAWKALREVAALLLSEPAPPAAGSSVAAESTEDADEGSARGQRRRRVEL